MTQLDRIKPIIEICEKIERKNGNLDDHLESLREIKAKGKFYESHSLDQLQKMLKKNPVKDPKQIRKMIQYINEIITNLNGNYNINLHYFYNFVKDTKDLPDIQRILVEEITFLDEKTDFKSTEILLHIIKKFFVSEIFATDKKVRAKVMTHFRYLIKNASTEKADQLIVFMQIFEIMSNLKLESLIVDFVMELSNIRIEVCNDNEVFETYMRMIKYLVTLDMPEAVQKYTKSMTKSFQNENHRLLNEIVVKIVSQSKTREVPNVFKELREMIKNIKVDSNIQKILDIFKIHLRSHWIVETTTDYFTSFHNVLYDLIKLISKLKVEKSSFTCCKDDRRHEIHDLLSLFFNTAREFVKKKQFFTLEAKYTDFYITYSLQICNELAACEKVQRLILRSYSCIYNFLFEVTQEKETVVKLMGQKLCSAIKTLYVLYAMLSEETKIKQQQPSPLVFELFDITYTSETAAFIADAQLIYLHQSLKINYAPFGKDKMIMKAIYLLRDTVRMLDYQSATQFIIKKNMEQEFFQLDLPTDLLQVYEIRAMLRYSQVFDDKCTTQMSAAFKNLCLKGNLDLKYFAMACQVMSDEMIKIFDIESFQQLNNKLIAHEKKLVEKDVTFSIGLGFNYYFLYFIENDKHKKKFATCDNKGIMNGKFTELVKNLNLQDEITALNYLDKSLDHFSDAFLVIRDDSSKADKIFSNCRVLKILENISIQYIYRGIEYKDMEAMNLLWNFINEDTDWTSIINCAACLIEAQCDLLDESGNRMRLSKKVKSVDIVDVIDKSQKTLENKIMNFEDLEDFEQFYVLNYLQSMWFYNAVKGLTKGSMRWFNEYDRLFNLSNVKDKPPYFHTLTSKLLHSTVQININTFKQNANSILFDAVRHIMKIKSLTPYLVTAYHRAFRRLVTTTINYSMNRLTDMDLYGKLMITCKANAIVSGYFFRTAEYISMSILRHLNMEKLEFAKTDLKEFSTLLGINEEILIETPTNLKTNELEFNFYHSDLSVRKTNLYLDDSELCLSPHNDEPASLLNQLSKVIHPSNCKCTNCQYPLVKFLHFQFGCYYSRLMWLLGKYDVSEGFNSLALEQWRAVYQKVLLSKDCGYLSIKKKSFVVFSIRWLSQVADTLIRLEKYEEADEIYSQIGLICSPCTPDYDCVQQDLHCRKESLQFLLDGGMKKIEKTNQRVELSFEEFMKRRGISTNTAEPLQTRNESQRATLTEHPVVNPEATTSIQPPTTSTSKKSPNRKPAASAPYASTKARPKKATPKDESVIFIDSSDDEKKSSTKPKKTAPQKAITRPRKAATTSKSSANLAAPSVTTRSRRMI